MMLLCVFVGLFTVSVLSSCGAAIEATPIPVATETPIPPLEPTAQVQPILSELVSKTFRKANINAGEFQDKIEIEIRFENETGKNLKAFTGVIKFIDLFDKEIYQATMTYEEGLDAGEGVNYEGILEFNQFMDDMVRLRDAKTENVRAVFETE